MPRFDRLAALPEPERRDFCRRVMESLSDLVDGSAAPDWRDQVEDVLGDANGFQALCDTLKEVVSLARECGDEAAAGVDETALKRAVERVRSRLLPTGPDGQ